MAKILAKNLSSKPESDDEERLLKLFWNRAELKKEFATLRREGEDLKAKLQKQEGVTMRAQQRLEQLEGMLSDPLQGRQRICLLSVARRMGQLQTQAGAPEQGT